MTEYKKGQRVKVEFEGVVNYTFRDSFRPHALDYVDPDGGFTITLLDPQDWPPQMGDIYPGEKGC